MQRTVGFGFGIFLIPLLFLLGIMDGDYKSIVSLSSMMAATLSLITVWDLRKSLDWHYIWPLLIVFIPTSTFFSYVMFGTDASWLKIILGITLILLSIYFTFFKKEGIKIKPNWFNTISLGSLSGLMGGLFSMQGPPVVYYYLSTQKTKEEYESLESAIEVRISGGGTTSVQPFDETREPMLDEMGNPIMNMMGQPEISIKRTQKKIPYYRPNIYPIILRKNITAQNRLIGGSDVAVVIDQQDTIKKLGTKINEKLIKGGSFVTLPKDVDVEKDSEELNILRIDNPGQKALIDTLTLQPNVQNDQTYLEINYSWAKSTLGITDSYQGKYDASATSGTAKQYSINQAAGRLDSKRTLKNEAYAKLYEAMFKFWLAFSDSPSKITSTDSDGAQVFDELDRKEFLRLDSAGEFYWDDEFIFETDPTSTLMQNREAMWSQTDMKLQSGAFGPVGDLETARAYWTIMKANGYPSASVVLNIIEERLNKQREQEQMLAQAQAPEGEMNVLPQM